MSEATVEEEMLLNIIEKSSRPTLSELFRRGVDLGIINPVPEYSGMPAKFASQANSPF